MPLFPPELARPFRSPLERAEARRRLEQRDHTLRLIEVLASKPDQTWSGAERAVIPSTTNGITEPPPQRVARWASLFAEELAEVHRLASRRRPLSDIELQEAVYLAGRLLATVTDSPIDRVDLFRIGG